MRTTFLAVWAATAVLALLLTPGVDRAQPPGAGKSPKPPPDEFRSLVKEVEEAYKAPFEVDKDVLDELRKQYKNPTPEREAKILREVRRLYPLTPGQERDLVAELRRAYERPSPDGEARVFQMIRRNGRLPVGTVPESIQADQAAKLFRGFDRDGDGRLTPDEMPEALRGQWRRWDRDGDGAIDFPEYADYYAGHLRFVAERVAAGEITIKVPKGALPPADAPPPQSEPPLATGPDAARDPLPFAIRFGKLPPGLPVWFAEYDTDQDGQVGLYEWRQKGRAIDEFTAMDRDGDALLTPEELLRFLAARARQRPATTEADGDRP